MAYKRWNYRELVLLLNEAVERQDWKVVEDVSYALKIGVYESHDIYFPVDDYRCIKKAVV